MDQEKKSLGALPEEQIHWLDHIAPMCVLMDIPLLFISGEDYEKGVRLYPQLKAFVPEQAVTREYLFSNWDVVFYPESWNYEQFRLNHAHLEKRHHKIMRKIYCPHGFSDKSAYLQRCVHDDITLVYGDHMLDQLKLHGVRQLFKRYVMVGNYRYAYYKKNKEHFDSIVEADYLSKLDKSKKTILYAPTWMGLEEGSSFFEACEALVDNLPENYNLILKLHPRLESDDISLYYHITGKYQEHKNVAIVEKYPLVYPFLARSDIYIGEISSVGYDYLCFNRPMFFLNRYGRSWRDDPGVYLHRCGVDVSFEKLPEIYSIIEKTLPSDQKEFTEIRKQVYDYSFVTERPWEAIKADIIKEYNKPL